jgi:uncharacterized protein YlbG (UPF0298 family)
MTIRVIYLNTNHHCKQLKVSSSTIIHSPNKSIQYTEMFCNDIDDMSISSKGFKLFTICLFQFSF